MNISRHSIFPQLSIIVGVVIYLVVKNINKVWSGSFDMAHHYALVVRVGELFDIPRTIDPSLGEMNSYPPASHMMAAWIGYFLHSPLMGMHVLSLLSVMMVWGGIFYIVRTLPGKPSIWSAALLVLALLINYKYLKFDIFGGEIIGNYFFAQLVGYAIFLPCLAIILQFERNAQHTNIRYLFALLTLFVLLHVHLLAAVQFLGCFCILVALDFLISWQQKGRLKRLFFSFGIILLSIFIVLKNPYYQSMKETSGINGDLHLSYLNSVSGVAIFAGIVGLISALILMVWVKLGKDRSNYLALKYMASMALSMALLCVLQYILLKFGLGSEYSVKKYIFGLNSIFLIELIFVFVLFLNNRFRRFFERESREILFRQQAILAVGIFLSFIWTMPKASIMPMSVLVTFERQIVQKRHILNSQKDKFNYVAELNNTYPIHSYLYSIGLLHAMRRSEGPAVVSIEDIALYPKMNIVITSENSLLDRYYDCRKTIPQAGLVEMDGPCMLAGKKRSANKPTLINFSAIESGYDCQLQGLGNKTEVEPSGRWTQAKHVNIQCPIPKINGRRPQFVYLETSAFLQKIPRQKLILQLNEASPQEFIYDSSMPKRVIKLPLIDEGRDVIALSLDLPDAISPKQLGLSEDPRVLGLMMHNMRFE